MSAEKVDFFGFRKLTQRQPQMTGFGRVSGLRGILGDVSSDL